MYVINTGGAHRQTDARTESGSIEVCTIAHEGEHDKEDDDGSGEAKDLRRNQRESKRAKAHDERRRKMGELVAARQEMQKARRKGSRKKECEERDENIGTGRAQEGTVSGLRGRVRLPLRRVASPMKDRKGSSCVFST
jgi:hypothetical protein